MEPSNLEKEISEDNNSSSGSEWEELMGGGLKFKKTKHGDGEEIEVNKCIVCNYKMFSDPDGILLEETINEKFVIGEADTVPGLELAIRHSRIGDSITIICASRFGYGLGRKCVENLQEIKPNTDLRFEVDILSAETPPESENPQEAVVWSVSLRKEAGNRWFKYHEYQRAARCYSKGAQTAEGSLGASAPTEADTDADPNSTNNRLNSLFVDCLNNLAACHMSMGDYFKSKEVCLKLLEIDANNKKGLLRAAKTSIALANFEDAELCLSRLLALDPDSENAKKEQLRLKKLQKEYKAKSAQVAKNMAKHLFSDSQGNAPGDGQGEKREKQSPNQISESGNSSDVKGSTESTTNTSTETEPSSASNQTGENKPPALSPQSGWSSSLSKMNSTVLLTAASLLVLIVSVVVAYLAQIGKI